MYLQFERYFEMFSIISILVLGILKVESEQTQCQMIPIKTDNGLTGHCCIYLKDPISERKKERIAEQIFKYPPLIDDKVKQKASNIGNFDQRQEPGRMKNTEKLLDTAEHRNRNNVEKITFMETPDNRAELGNYYSGKVKFTGQSGENLMFESTTKKFSTIRHLGGGTTGEAYASSSEETSTISGNNSVNGNGTKVIVDNRNNIDSPKVCNGSTQKTSNGDCEPRFG